MKIPTWRLVAFLIPFSTEAATLKTETVEAWDAYVQTVDQTLQDRTHPGRNFLWTLEDPARAAKVRSGELVVAPAPGQNPKNVPGGLIHHWIGAAFLPGLTLDRILQVTRDYDRYKDFYTPYVVHSNLVARDGLDDRFTMQIMNKALFLKTVLDADYQTTTVIVDNRRAYTVSHTTRVQEIEDYGHPTEHKMPEGAGGGYVWKLHSIARVDQRDGGVYIELEAVVLSRDIPVAVRFVAEPIVRKVSRNSLLTALEQTGRAALPPATISATARQLTAPAASFSNKLSLNSDIH